jgi:flagellar motor switch/type III secretory pathway protein FliN
MSQVDSQPLLFLGEKRRQVVTERVADALRRWRQSWSEDAAAQFDVGTEAPTAEGFTSPVASVATTCWALELGAQRLAVLLLPHATFAWAVQGAGTPVIDTGPAVAADSLAEQLEQEVATSLLSELCQVGRREPLSVVRLASDALLEWSRGARAWTMHAKASNGRGLSVLLAASRMETLAPARAPVVDATLESRRDSIGANTVSLRGVVGETFLSMSELSELALDDVLVLDQALAEPVTLVAPDSGGRVAAGNLGRVGARRAIKVVGIPARQNQ